MCNPALFLQGAAGGVQAIGQIQQGRWAAEAAAFSARQMEQAATDAENRGRLEAGSIRREYRNLASFQAAQYAASGVDIGDGAPLDVMSSTTYLGERDASTAELNSQREAWGLRSQAAMERAQGDMARSGGWLNAAGTLIGTASQIYGRGTELGLWDKKNAPAPAPGPLDSVDTRLWPVRRRRWFK